MFLGDMCKLKVLKQGEVMTVEVKLDLVTSLVPTQLYDKRPRYVLTDCNTRHTQVSASGPLLFRRSLSKSLSSGKLLGTPIAVWFTVKLP